MYKYISVDPSGSRQQVTLSAPFARGAAGSIHKIVGQNRVAKIYLNKSDAVSYRAKINAMLAAPPNLPPVSYNKKLYVQLAWPEAYLVDGLGEFCGFVMPEVDLVKSSELENVLQRASRVSLGLPESYSTRVLLAHNLAALMTELHSLSHFMVDMKPINMRFYSDVWYMAILDTDGFSIGGVKTYPAQQFSEEYIAPEAQRKSPMDLGLEQDLFALSVIIFRLLNNGIHPFQGRDLARGLPTTLQDRIFLGLYAYGKQRDSRVEPSLPSIHESFEEESRTLFDRAFRNATRPSALDWRNHLSRLINGGHLRKCATNPIDHAHFTKGCGLCALETRTTQLTKRATPVAPSQHQLSGAVLSGIRPANNRSKFRATGQRGHGTSGGKPLSGLSITRLPGTGRDYKTKAFFVALVFITLFVVLGHEAPHKTTSSFTGDLKAPTPTYTSVPTYTPTPDPIPTPTYAPAPTYTPNIEYTPTPTPTAEPSQPELTISQPSESRWLTANTWYKFDIPYGNTTFLVKQGGIYVQDVSGHVLFNCEHNSISLVHPPGAPDLIIVPCDGLDAQLYLLNVNGRIISEGADTTQEPVPDVPAAPEIVIPQFVIPNIFSNHGKLPAGGGYHDPRYR